MIWPSEHTRKQYKKGEWNDIVFMLYKFINAARASGYNIMRVTPSKIISIKNGLTNEIDVSETLNPSTNLQEVLRLILKRDNDSTKYIIVTSDTPEETVISLVQ